MDGAPVTNHTLFYVYDPMCSWCWAFSPVWSRLKLLLHDNEATLSTSGSPITIEHVTGGLAPDSDQPMPEPLRQRLQGAWRKIQQVVPGTEFNFDFWENCEPRRSTWPACRAVLAAKFLDSRLEQQMITSIQEAYYLQARNPSDIDTLVSLAENIGLSASAFEQQLLDEQTETLLQQNLQLAQQLGVSGFPSLVLFTDTPEPTLFNIAIDYLQPMRMYQQILSAMHSH